MILALLGELVITAAIIGSFAIYSLENYKLVFMAIDRYFSWGRGGGSVNICYSPFQLSTLLVLLVFELVF